MTINNPRKILIHTIALLAVSLGSLASADEGSSRWMYRFGDRLSIGYFRAGLIGPRSRRHAFGFYAGQFERSETAEHEKTRGLGMGYVFFLSGTGNNGLTLGLGYEIGKTEHRSDHHQFRAQLGVQF